MQPEAERALADLASRQGGVVSRAQLVAIGMSNAGVARRVRAGRLIRLQRGVYAVGHLALRTEGRLLAAALACGDGAVVSHRSAAHLWGLRPSSRSKVDVTTPYSGRRQLRGIHLHRTVRLDPTEVTAVDGVPVTAVGRTLADLAAVVRRRELERAIERADALELLDVGALMRSARRRRGAPAIAAILDAWAPAPTRSELEARLLDLVTNAGLPAPRVNARVHGLEVDLLWRAERVVVEADGHAYHASRAAIERDRRRDAVLARRGYRVLRFTWRQVTSRPHEVIAALRAALN